MIIALTKLATVNLPVIAVSLLFLSQSATANEVAVGAAESMSFQAAPQALTPQYSPAEYLNSLGTIPQGQVQGGVPGQTPGSATGKPYTWALPKKSSGAKKDDSNNQIMNQLGNMMPGGGAGSARGGAGSGATSGQYSDAAKYSNNSTSEGGFCYQCQYGQHNGTSGLPMEKVSGYVNADSVSEMSEKEKCYAKYLEGELPQALRNTPYAGRSSSGGQCAHGVRLILGNAGLSKKGQVLGDAINYADRKDLGLGERRDGSLTKLGFRKLEGFTAQNAPAGAVLVYGGPKSKAYMAGKAAYDGTGTTLGHVTIKGKDGFYTDGKTTNPAGMRRYLVGVYVMSTCANCDDKVKARCESAGGGT